MAMIFGRWAVSAVYVLMAAVFEFTAAICVTQLSDYQQLRVGPAWSHQATLQVLCKNLAAL